MKFLHTILVIILIHLPGNLAAQNYFYVHGQLSTDEKKSIRTQTAYISGLFDMQDVTIAVFICELPQNFNATIEYQQNQQVSRKMILIRLSNSLEPKDYVSTISHEMIHAYQYYTGDLIRHTRTNFTWKGTAFKNIQIMEHAKRPWEIEAIDLSNALADSYLDFKNNLNILSKEPSLNISTLRK